MKNKIVINTREKDVYLDFARKLLSLKDKAELNDGTLFYQLNEDEIFGDFGPLEVINLLLISLSVPVEHVTENETETFTLLTDVDYKEDNPVQLWVCEEALNLLDSYIVRKDTRKKREA